jgi:hypothetical protein
LEVSLGALDALLRRWLIAASGCEQAYQQTWPEGTSETRPSRNAALDGKAARRLGAINREGSAHCDGGLAAGDAFLG